MMFRMPEDTYRAYERFLRKRNHRKAYQCLESLLHQFPGDEALLVDIVNLTYFDWRNYERALPWLAQLAKIRSRWLDYALLTRCEVQLGKNHQAREHLNRAKELAKKETSPRDKSEAKQAFLEIEDLMKYY